MQALRELQTRFIDYLTDGSAGIESMIEAKDKAEQQTRLYIYKNAYRIRLRQVLETDHDMLWTYLGDMLFEQLVNGYIDSHPSRYNSLRYFCDQLPDYLANTAPFKQHPILAEIATFERLLMDVFDAGEADRAGLSELRALNPDDWPAMRLRFHPGVQLLQTDWNSVESWKALKDEKEPPAASNEASQHWLLWRDTDRLSQFRPVEKDEHALLSQALSGEAFSALCEALLDWYPVDEVSVVSLRYITEWLDQGLIAKIAIESDNDTPKLV
jgi:hypothetical protein